MWDVRAWSGGINSRRGRAGCVRSQRDEDAHEQPYSSHCHEALFRQFVQHTSSAAVLLSRRSCTGSKELWVVSSNEHLGILVSSKESFFVRYAHGDGLACLVFQFKTECIG